MTIWKFFIDLSQLALIELPEDSNLLHLGVQGDQIYAWFLVDPKKPTTKRKFGVFGTGHYVDTGWKHVGTVQISSFVWHVFEDVK